LRPRLALVSPDGFRARVGRLWALAGARRGARLATACRRAVRVDRRPGRAQRRRGGALRRGRSRGRSDRPPGLEGDPARGGARPGGARSSTYRTSCFPGSPRGRARGRVRSAGVRLRLVASELARRLRRSRCDRPRAQARPGAGRRVFSGPLRDPPRRGARPARLDSRRHGSSSCRARASR